MSHRLYALFITALAASCSPSEPSSTNVGEEKSAQSSASDAPAAQSAGDGPFGLPRTAGPSSLAIDADKSDASQGFYILSSVPNPSTDFETYAVKAFEGVGICEIRAVSGTYENDGNGVSARSKADELAEAIASKYGKGRKIDNCSGYACQSEHWTMHINDGSRYYGHEWKKPNRNIRAIDVAVFAPDITSTFVRLDYALGDAESCKRAADKAKGASL